MNRDQLAATARGAGAVTAGAAPFVAIGWLVSWWLAGGIVLAIVALALGSLWWLSRRLPSRWMPW